jgi:hypothetical protein
VLAIEAINKVARSDQMPPSQYHVDDQVWLEATNLKFPHQTVKLLAKHHGPFQITEEISPVAYRLALPRVGTSTMYSMHRYCTPIMKLMHTGLTTHNHHQN